MLNENIESFMEKTNILGKDLAIYKDEEKGNIFPLGTASLLCRVEALELTNEEKTVAEFQQQIDKITGIDKVKVQRPRSKYEITKKDEDRYTIVNSDVMVYKLWNVANQLKVKQTFTSKEDAIKLCESVNKQVTEALTIKTIH